PNPKQTLHPVKNLQCLHPAGSGCADVSAPPAQCSCSSSRIETVNKNCQHGSKMLLCRGKAVKDFSGPDCRFLSFKASETVYVYYKLAGKRSDLWAGSVGSHFGYFPMDLLAVNHRYTDKELEVRAEETDFVCFDTGFDRFDNYDVDLLLGTSAEESDSDNKGPSDQIQVAEDTEKEPQPSEEPVADGEKQTEHQDYSADLNEVPGDQSASLPELDMAAELPYSEVVEPDTTAVPDVTERAEETEQKNRVGSAENDEPAISETKDTPTESESKDEATENEPVSISEGEQIPELKTTFGSTFDAVTTDEDITSSVTPFEEEENKDGENPTQDSIDVIEETPLLSFSEEAEDSPASDSLDPQEAPPAAHEDQPQATEEKNMWTSIGDAVFSVVTGGEKTAENFSSDEEEDDDDEEEEAASKTPPVSEYAMKDVEKPLTAESPKEPENTDHVPQDPPDSSSAQTDKKETNSDSERLLFQQDDESDGVIRPEETWNETSKPIEDTLQRHHQTEASPKTDDLVSQEDISEKSSFKTADEPMDHQEEEGNKVSRDSAISDDSTIIQHSNIVMEQTEDVDIVLEENKTVTDQEVASTETEKHPDLHAEEKQFRDIGAQDEKKVDDSLPIEIHDHLMTDFENISQPDLSVEEPQLHEEPHKEEREEEKDAELEKAHVEEKEELLEDENALLFSQSDNMDIDKPSLVAETTASTPEPEYSDSVMRLTLLRDHFTEENMERIQRLLGLTNLFKVEAMFTDLDTELHSTRLSQEGTTQDIESALEAILEASENTILDEIEKMLDSRNPKHDYNQHMDANSLDEETEILDDFQELAFSLRQKYSTVSDSAPLATEEASNIELDQHKVNIEEKMPHIEHNAGSVSEPDSEDNGTVTDHEERPAETEKEPIVLDKMHTGPEVSMEEDGGHFNKNKDNQPGFSASDEMQKVPQATLENPLDMGLGVKVEHSSSGSLDPLESVSEIHEEEVGLFSAGIVYTGCILSIINTKMSEWTTVVMNGKRRRICDYD
ncbi:hypothetical protein INR49_026351, partial [Caranx melampygus]